MEMEIELRGDGNEGIGRSGVWRLNEVADPMMFKEIYV